MNSCHPFMYYTNQKEKKLVEVFKEYLEKVEFDLLTNSRCTCKGKCFLKTEDYGYDFQVDGGEKKIVVFQNIPTQLCAECNQIIYDYHIIETLKLFHYSETFARLNNNEPIPEREVIEFEEMLHTMGGRNLGTSY